MELSNQQKTTTTNRPTIDEERHLDQHNILVTAFMCSGVYITSEQLSDISVVSVWKIHNDHNFIITCISCRYL